jgi:hypothetical protein
MRNLENGVAGQLQPMHGFAMVATGTSALHVCARVVAKGWKTGVRKCA